MATTKRGRPLGSTRGRFVANFTYSMEPATHAEVLRRCKQITKETGKKFTRGQLVAQMINETRK